MSHLSPSRDEHLNPPLSQQLAEFLGTEAVLPTDGYSVGGVGAEAVVRPASRQQVGQVLEWANRNRLSVVPWGGGVLSGLGNVSSRVDLVMDLSRLNRVVDYQPADLTATVEAGITLEEMRRQLAQGQKLVPLEAPFPRRATVGGILATNFSGPMRYTYGLPRDWLIGVTVAGATGEETRSGGKVVKNVTGYDLNKLYTGSLGSLGLFVEATFKLTPMAEAGAGLVASFPTLDGAIAAGRSLVSQVYAPQGLQVVNGTAAGKLGLELPSSCDGAALAFMEGRPRATARRTEESARLLSGAESGAESGAGAASAERLDEASSASLAQRLTELGWDEGSKPVLGLRIDLPPSRINLLMESLSPSPAVGIIADVGFGTVQVFHWQRTPASEADAANLLSHIANVRAAAQRLGGTVVVEHCSPAVKEAIDVWEGCCGDSELEIMRRIKAKFDPQGILNPGRFIGRI